MPKCCVVGCGGKHPETQKSLSLHRLPKTESKRKKWLEAIGTENLRTNVKDQFICSLHFHESALNKTMGVIRLRDDAIPQILHKKPITSQDDSDLLAETDQGKGNISSGPPLKDPLDLSNSIEPITSTSQDDSDLLAETNQGKGNISSRPPLTDPLSLSNLLTEESKVAVIATHPVRGNSVVLNLKGLLKVKDLERRCALQRRKIRTLNEKIRRQGKKIAEYKNTIKELQERNVINKDSSITLEACATNNQKIRLSIFM